MTTPTGWFDRIRRRHGDAPPRDVYGNTVEEFANVEGERRLVAARRAFGDAPLDRARHRAYERMQYDPLDDLALDPILFESIRERSVAALDDPEVSPCAWRDRPKPDGIGDVRRYTTDVRGVVPDVPRLLHDGFVSAIQSCLGGHFALEFVYLTRNFHVPAAITATTELLSDRWHFDDQYSDGFSLFVCLSDVTEADGPFHCVGRLDSRRLLRQGYDKARRIESFTGGLDETTIERARSFRRLVGPPGTKLLCHTSFCLHRAGRPEPGHTRDMLVFTFRPALETNVDWPAGAVGIAA